ncbi:S8 family serine peptidase [Peribacillus butanolivorans]|uniref:S8 family serine peptidase n=1 Tax=Peribacillus butanolivorans TaxID=421767 RepID=UPI00167FC818|nr:S8 family serine peptidase [Peribacillus butanolivorans]QNU02677.1 S8 family serine peptidase [Peribacillus butanolivorans]
MLRKISFILSVFLLIFFFSNEKGLASVILPPLPKLSESKKVTVVVTMERPISQEKINKLLEKYPSLHLRNIYTVALDGFSVYGKKNEIEQLKKESAIQAATEVSMYHALLDESVPFIGGDRVRSFFDKKNHRITGKGVKVGIIDTGIDYTHPDLQRNYKGGKDLVDSDEDPMETKNMGGLNTIHGTHVAGIIAANGKMMGVAPEAEIYAYRALGPGGAGDTEQVLTAIESAMKDKVDVLNLSLGNNVNGPDLPISLALNKAVESGIVAVTSNGNSGPAVWTVGSPGTAEKAISVGASTPPLKVPYMVYGLGSKKYQSYLTLFQGSKKWNLTFSEEVIYGNIGNENELKHVKDKIVLLERGTLTFQEKVSNAEKAGAKAVIIYNNMSGTFTGSLEKEMDIPVASINRRDGLRLKKFVDQKKHEKVQFVYKKEQDRLADFSSRGPVTVSWGIKPDVLAPGVEIESTIPKGYMSLAGTSMSAPHVAGACALILQKHPEWTPDQVKSALMSTSKPLSKTARQLYHTYEQGAGRIQVAEALKADTLLYPSSLSFGMYTKKEGIEEHHEPIVLENTGKKIRRYSFIVPLKEKGLIWDLPKSITLNPSEKKAIDVGLQVNPSELKKGVYDGYLIIMEGSKKISLPYLYVKEEPDYPRVMGFEFGQGDQAGTYRYEMYLPRGAEEFGIALYDADTLKFAGYMDWSKPAPSGLTKKNIYRKDLPPKGVYKAIIFARRNGREDRIEKTLLIE